MSAEQRRQLLAFSIVALVAVLLVGTTLHSQSVRDAISGHAGGTARAIATGVTIVPGPGGVELGGSARGTTAKEQVVVEVAPVTASRATSDAQSMSQSISQSISPDSTSPDPTPARSDKSPKAPRAEQASGSPGKSKHLTAQSTAQSSGVLFYRASGTAKGKGKSDSAHAKKAQSKEHGKKHNNGKSQAAHARRA